MINSKKGLLIGVLAVFVIAGTMYLSSDKTLVSKGYRDTTFTVAGTLITLSNGVSKTSGTLAAAPVLTQYNGGDVTGDFNNDGLTDVALFLTQASNTGSTNLFYYVAVSLNNGKGYTGTNAVLLGDNISGQKIEYKDGIITVSYLSHAFGEPTTAEPSVMITKYLTLNGVQLVEDRLPTIGKYQSHKDMVLVTYPTPNTTIQSPVTITGVANNAWFYSTSFPVVLLDGNGKEIASTAAKITNISKTTDYTAFTAAISFKKPSTKTGTLVFKKSVGPGAGQTADQYLVPVQF